MAFCKSLKTDFRQYDRQRIVILKNRPEEIVLLTVIYRHTPQVGIKLAHYQPKNDHDTIVEDWMDMVQDSEGPSLCSDTTVDKTKRLTIDISEPLHRALKIKAVTDGVTMAEIVRELLMRQFSENGINSRY
jgi:predicted DNA binding CopG/RHH family protein